MICIKQYACYPTHFLNTCSYIAVCVSLLILYDRNALSLKGVIAHLQWMCLYKHLIILGILVLQVWSVQQDGTHKQTRHQNSPLR